MKQLLCSLAFSAAWAAGAAQAGTVQLTTLTGLIDGTGGKGTTFSLSKAFTLSEETWGSGSLITLAPVGELPVVDIQSVLLTHAGVAISWNELVAVNWNFADAGVEQWAMPMQRLAAGDWLLQVAGVSYAVKNGNGFDASVELPEPQSAALAVLALLGATGVTLRRRAF